MAGETRKYHVQHIDADTGKVTRERIIDATNRATARAHASNTTIAVELLDADAALRLGAAGVKTEKADSSVTTQIKGVHPDQAPLLPLEGQQNVGDTAE